MNRHFLGDTTVLLGRSLRHIVRSPDTIITTVVTPIAMLLLFVYVLGGAISTGTASYVNYLVPGILIIVWVALQAIGALAWIPAVRRLRGDEAPTA